MGSQHQLLFLLCFALLSNASLPTSSQATTEKTITTRLMKSEIRRRLGSFQVCALCTCCSPKGVCVPSPCCYAINCNIPNRPFGVCAFTPKVCNCLGCHV